MINPSNNINSAREAAFRAASVFAEESTHTDNNNPSIRIEGAIPLNSPGSNSLSGFAGDPKPSTSEPDLAALSTEELHTRADELRSEIVTAGFSEPSAANSHAKLSDVNEELERRSLNALEAHLVETENAEDNILSVRELEDLANDTSLPQETRLAAQFYLDNDKVLDKLDSADVGDEGPDGKFGLRDIHTRQLEINNDIENIDVPTSDTSTTYQLPDGSGNISTNDSLPRNQAAYDLQQDAIETAIRTGEPVDFVNSEGKTISVTVEAIQDGSAGEFNVKVDGDEFTVTSELGIAETIGGIASIVEFGSALELPQTIRRFPDSVTFDKHYKTEDDGSLNTNTNATYSSDHNVTYWEGSGDSNFQSTQRYYHELAHGIARDLPDSDGSLPAGWEAVFNDVGKPGGEDYVSGYGTPARGGPKEAFAETFAAYMQARDYGSAELQIFRDHFPSQAQYIEEYVLGITPAAYPPV